MWAAFPAPIQTMKSLLLLTVLPLLTAAQGAIVLTNLTEPVTTTVLVKGTGGFIPTAQEYGFEFTVGGGDHRLDTITVGVGVHFGTLPLTVELYESPSGPDSAVFLTAMTGPSQPADQLATYTPASYTELTDGSTYFLRFWVNGNASSYGIQKTNPVASGTFAMGDNYQRTAGGSWGSGTQANESLAEITATPIPEPAAALLGGLGTLLVLRRRRA